MIQIAQGIPIESKGNLVADVLEDERHFWKTNFSPQKVVMVVLQLSVGEVIPPADAMSAKEQGCVRRHTC